MRPSRVSSTVVVTCACLAALLLPAMASANPYVALGDSVTASDDSYAGLLYPDFQSGLGADEFLKRAMPGATSESIRNGLQLTMALADIDAASDTKVVTAGIGGGDALFGACDSNFDVPAECDFRANFTSIMQQLQSALAADPGTEALAVLAYYNPKNGLAGEADFDRKLLGANGEVGPCDAGLDVGLNDVIYQTASDLGILVADAYPPFKTAGQAFMSGDQIHPNAEGQAAIAQAFRDAEVPPVPFCLPKPTCETDASLCPELPDTKRPQTRITKGPVRLGKRSVKFVFGSSEKGSKFQCSLDGRKSSRCKSPKKLKRLKRGKHTFRVRATDAAGNVDKSPAKRRFRVRG